MVFEREEERIFELLFFCFCFIKRKKGKKEERKKNTHTYVCTSISNSTQVFTRTGTWLNGKANYENKKKGERKQKRTETEGKKELFLDMKLIYSSNLGFGQAMGCVWYQGAEKVFGMHGETVGVLETQDPRIRRTN